MNHKKVERIYYRDEGLSFGGADGRRPWRSPASRFRMPTQPGRCYAMDFVHDRLVTGRRFKCLTMTDPYSKEVPVIEVDVSIGGERVCRILDRLFNTRPLPETVILDNGPEFAGTALDAWAVSTVCICTSFSRGSRCRTRLLRASTASFATNVLTSTGF